ncbi:hypothetical protein MTR_7g066930 [Medicago truncatula]|uniref:Uncharacterized protein n=1 Tax=Medicago truncatula TaxID=3880 RepID=A0A072U1T8_MEDTR|nr:hypothetical protein MTR_7g066930 [Medicago truncatula]
MTNYLFFVSTKITAVYYSRGKPNLFRVHVDVTLSNLKDQLDQIKSRLNQRERRRVDNVEYCQSSIDSDGSTWFT